MTSACDRSSSGSPPVTTAVAPVEGPGLEGPGGEEPTTTTEVATTTTTTTTTTIPGRPRTDPTVPAEIGGGTARISGTVVGPAGAVANATVRVERFVGDQVTALSVTTAAGGQFNVPSVRGGNYRLKAWRAPDLILLQPEALFLGAEEAKTVELRVANVSDLNVQAAAEPVPLPREEPFTVTVTLYSGVVAADGTLSGTSRPQVNVQLVPSAAFGVEGSDRAVTDAAGRASFRARCTTPGTPRADVVIGAVRLPIALPNCPG
jgi:hypothetical protein